MSGDIQRGRWFRFFLVVAGLVFIGLAGLVMLFLWKRLPPTVPWLYSLPWGEGQLIPKMWLFVGLLILAAVNLLNIVLSIYFVKMDRVVANVLLSANLLIDLLFLVSFWQVLSILILF